MNYRFKFGSLVTLINVYNDKVNNLTASLDSIHEGSEIKDWERLSKHIDDFVSAKDIILNADLKTEGVLHEKIIVALNNLSRLNANVYKDIKTISNSIKDVQKYINDLTDRDKALKLYPIEIWKDWLAIVTLNKEPHPKLSDIFVPEYNFGDLYFTDQVETPDGQIVIGEIPNSVINEVREAMNQFKIVLAKLEPIYNDDINQRGEYLKTLAKIISKIEKMKVTEGYQPLFLGMKTRIVMSFVSPDFLVKLKDHLPRFVYDMESRLLNTENRKNHPNKDFLQEVIVELVSLEFTKHINRSETFQEADQRFGISHFITVARNIIEENNSNVTEILRKNHPVFISLEKSMVNAWNEFSAYHLENEEDLNEAGKEYRRVNNEKIVKYLSGYQRFKDIMPEPVKTEFLKPLNVIIEKLQKGELNYRNKNVLSETASYITLFGYYIKKYFKVEAPFVKSMLKQSDRLMVALMSAEQEQLQELKNIGEVDWNYIGKEVQEISEYQPYNIARIMVSDLIRSVNKYIESENEKDYLERVPETADNLTNLLRTLDERDAAKLIKYSGNIVETLLDDKPNVSLSEHDKKIVVKALMAVEVFLEFFISKKVADPREPLKEISKELFNKDVQPKFEKRIVKEIVTNGNREIEQDLFENDHVEHKVEVASMDMTELTQLVEPAEPVKANIEEVQSLQEPQEPVYEPVIEKAEENIVNNIFNKASEKVAEQGEHIYQQSASYEPVYTQTVEEPVYIQEIEEEKVEETVEETVESVTPFEQASVVSSAYTVEEQEEPQYEAVDFETRKNYEYPPIISSHIERDYIDLEKEDLKDEYDMMIRTQLGDLLSEKLTEEDKEEWGFEGNDINRYIKARARALEGKVTKSQITDLRRMFHTLKGTFRSFYMKKVQDYAYKTEEKYNELIDHLQDNVMYDMPKSLLAISDYVFFEEVRMFEQLYETNACIDFNRGILDQLFFIWDNKEDSSSQKDAKIKTILSLIYKTEGDEEGLARLYEVFGEEVEVIVPTETDIEIEEDNEEDNDEFISDEEIEQAKAEYIAEGKPLILEDESETPVQSFVGTVEQENQEQENQNDDQIEDDEEEIDISTEIVIPDDEDQLDDIVEEENTVEENVNDTENVIYENNETTETTEIIVNEVDPQPTQLVEEVKEEPKSNKIIYNALGVIIEQLIIIREQFK